MHGSYSLVSVGKFEELALVWAFSSTSFPSPSLIFPFSCKSFTVWHFPSNQTVTLFFQLYDTLSTQLTPQPWPILHQFFLILTVCFRCFRAFSQCMTEETTSIAEIGNSFIFELYLPTLSPIDGNLFSPRKLFCNVYLDPYTKIFAPLHSWVSNIHFHNRPEFRPNGPCHFFGSTLQR